MALLPLNAGDTGSRAINGDTTHREVTDLEGKTSLWVSWPLKVCGKAAESHKWPGYPQTHVTGFIA